MTNDLKLEKLVSDAIESGEANNLLEAARQMSSVKFSSIFHYFTQERKKNAVWNVKFKHSGEEPFEAGRLFSKLTSREVCKIYLKPKRDSNGELFFCFTIEFYDESKAYFDVDYSFRDPQFFLIFLENLLHPIYQAGMGEKIRLFGKWRPFPKDNISETICILYNFIAENFSDFLTCDKFNTLYWDIVYQKLQDTDTPFEEIKAMVKKLDY